MRARAKNLAVLLSACLLAGSSMPVLAEEYGYAESQGAGAETEENATADEAAEAPADTPADVGTDYKGIMAFENAGEMSRIRMGVYENYVYTPLCYVEAPSDFHTYLQYTSYNGEMATMFYDFTRHYTAGELAEMMNGTDICPFVATTSNEGYCATYEIMSTADKTFEDAAAGLEGAKEVQAGEGKKAYIALDNKYYTSGNKCTVCTFLYRINGDYYVKLIDSTCYVHPEESYQYYIEDCDIDQLGQKLCSYIHMPDEITEGQGEESYSEDYMGDTQYTDDYLYTDQSEEYYYYG